MEEYKEQIYGSGDSILYKYKCRKCGILFIRITVSGGCSDTKIEKPQDKCKQCGSTNLKLSYDFDARSVRYYATCGDCGWYGFLKEYENE